MIEQSDSQVMVDIYNLIFMFLHAPNPIRDIIVGNF